MKNWNYENEQWTQLPSHLKHLPLFTRHRDFTAIIISIFWAIFLKFFGFGLYVRLKVHGSFKELYQKHPKLLIISNHSSHLDATSITAAVPWRYWGDLYISAAKDYWFKNPLFTFFSKYCLGAIPIDRKDKKTEAVGLINTLLKDLDRIWLILFPEGTRSPDGYVQSFKRGVSIFSSSTQTPILFLYIEGNSRLWPKGVLIPRPGVLNIHIGPVIPPTGDIKEVRLAYKTWVETINPQAYTSSET